ncbi:hypothetical protein V6N13_133116 [Hibiscus sabdariffa]|uniref:Uncharacterized protein n=1 Tax=Hibiscus sabdariffa TaxID=183260 RepID=A0ABR2PX95_9ROSI
MITRSKLVEQLRDYQIRSQNTHPALIFFSPKPHISSWVDVAVAIFCAFVFSLLVMLSYLSLYFRHFWLSSITLCLGIFLPLCLRGYRQALVKKRERKFLLPLSM